MKALLVVPLVMAAMLGFALELQDIAEDTADQTLEFADDMRYAMPCATRGIPITECSPNLDKTNFEPLVNRTLTTLQDVDEEAEAIRQRIIQEHVLRN